MPLTPLHLGPGTLVALLLLGILDLPTLIIASVIVDVEPLLVLVLGVPGPLHGFFHSFMGGILVVFFLAGVMIWIRPLFTPLLWRCKLNQSGTPSSILAAAVLGVYLHILLDATMHRDMLPLYPLEGNPFLCGGVILGLSILDLCLSCAAAAVGLYLLRWAFTQ